MRGLLLKKIFLITVISFTAVIGAGQIQLPEPNFENLKGKVKVITLVREYWIINGRPIPPKHDTVAQREFLADGKALRYSLFGNVERRDIYTYAEGKQSVETFYIDAAGRRVTAEKANFQARADVPYESDLCQVYSTKTERDKKAGIERQTETCSPGSIRATTTTEENRDSTYLRTVREDSVGRTYESVFIYNVKQNPIEFRYIVNNLKATKYTWNITYVNHKSDSTGNMVEAVASATHSSRPNQVVYQYVERFEIVYFP